MSNKTRKRIWPVSLMMAIAVMGVLAAFAVLAVAPNEASAHGGDTGSTHCDDLNDLQQLAHDSDPQVDHDCDTEPEPEPVPGGGTANASMPMGFGIEALDNGGRLSWAAPADVAEDASVVDYKIERRVYLQDRDNPIWQNTGDADFYVESAATTYRELGLSYGTTYTYRIQAVVEHSDGTKGYGDWSDRETIITANAGGRLMALLDPPGVPTIDSDGGIDAACDISVTVTWNAPTYAGTAPATDGNGMYVGPDYIGADGAGREEVGQPATIASYQVQSRAYMTGATSKGAWISGTSNDTMVMTTNVAYGMTYEYRVRAMNSAGLYGVWSTVVSEDLVEPAEPLQPTGLVVQATGPNTVELEWQAPDDPNRLWRTAVDYGRTGPASGNLKYVVERQVTDDNGTILVDWTSVRTQAHLYADEFEDNRTQAWADENAPAGLVNYRVSALVDDCNRSPAHQKNAVEVLDPVAQFVGSVEAMSSAGDATITWTPADNATSQVVIAVNAADDTDYCLMALGASASTHTCPGLNAGTTYVVLVIALHSGGYTLGNVVTHTVN